jgi:hypothetical protein
MASRIAGDRARQAERLTVDVAARLRPNEWSSVEIEMIDLSELGFSARCDARIQPGSGVSLDIPGIGTVEAQVEWQRGQKFGARFVVAIDLEKCRWTLRERSRALAELLVERAQASRAGRRNAEIQLRQQILRSLPVHKGSAA